MAGFGGYLGRPQPDDEQFDPAPAPSVGIGTVRIKPSLRTLEEGDPGYNDTGPDVPEAPPPVDEKAQLAEWAANRQRLQAMTPEQRRADSFRVVDPGQAPPARVARAPRPDLQPVGPGMQAQPFQSLAPLMPGDDGQAPSPPPRALASSGSSGGPPGMALQAMMGAGKGVNPDVARYLSDKYRDPQLESAQARSRVMGLINSASHIGDSMARNAGLQPSTSGDLDVNAPVQQYQQRKARTDELEKEDPNSPKNAALRRSLAGLKSFAGVDLSGVTAEQFPLLSKAIEQQGAMDLKREEQGAALKEKAREADLHSGDIRWQTAEHAKDRLAAIQAAREGRRTTFEEKHQNDLAERQLPGYHFRDNAPPSADAAKKMRDVVAVSDDIRSELAHWRASYEANGPSMFGGAGSDQELAKQKIVTRLKDMEKLGAISPSDAVLLRGQIADTSSLDSKVTRAETHRAKFDAMERSLHNTLAASAKAFNYEPDAPPPPVHSPAVASSGGKVAVILPDGRKGRVDPRDVPQVLAQGGKTVR